MKMIEFALVFCLVGQSLFVSQKPLTVSSQNEPQVAPAPLAVKGSYTDFIPGEVLVKFKSQVSAIRTPAGRLSTNMESLNTLMQRQGIQSADPIFMDALKPGVGARVTINGKQLAAPDLTMIYKLRLPEKNDVLATIKAFQSDPNVEYAEPNYIAHLTDTPNDPDYNQQWGLPAVHAEEAWAITQGNPAVTIAILDTGVDLNHPDLVGKIWTNPGEIPGNSIDDDGNGYIDDANGYDWANLDNTPQDDNGHGTHVAGVAAAYTNNNIGVAGVCWNCKIMPLKVLQSSGRGSYSDIAAAVYYASNKGAKVINMSLGGYSDSAVLRDALAAAYQTSVLVAAAGNDGICIGPGLCPDNNRGTPFFPAAYGFVVGVEATNPDGGHASFSNYDQDGPTTSGYNEGYNYAIRAPGNSIYSSMLDDTYASLSGTSMAAPMVAGAAGLLVSKNPTWSKEKIRAQLIQSATGVSDSSAGLLNIYSALIFSPSPLIKLVTGSIIVGDSAGDNDGKVDAGETVNLTMTLRNYGASEATGTVATLTTNDEYTNISTGSSSFGDISAYAANNDLADPFVFSVSSTAPNNHDITFQLNLTANGGGYIRELGTFILTVQRGVQVGGLIDTDTTWTADKTYMVTSSVIISSGTTLTIEPGTTIRFDQDTFLSINGALYAVGLPTAPIVFTSNGVDLPGYWGGISLFGSKSYLSFAVLEYAGSNLYASLDLDGSPHEITNNIFRYNDSGFGTIFSRNTSLIRFNNFIDNIGDISSGIYIWSGEVNYNNFINNPYPISSTCAIIDINPVGLPFSFKHNNIYNNGLAASNYLSLGCNSDSAVDVDASLNFWGTEDEAVIAQHIYDGFDSPGLGFATYIPFLSEPEPLAPPVLANIQLTTVGGPLPPNDPVGSELITATLDFSAPMNTTIAPNVSFGVASPYTQHSLQNGQWISSTRWVGDYSVDVTTGDGINTIRVADARGADGFFTIPTDTRFQFTIQTAGSSSLSLNASPGYGRVTLNWSASPLPNTIGYNVYRGLTNTEPYTDTPINTTLVTGTSYLDTNVDNGTEYFYTYAIVDTDLREVAFSNEVNATPNDYTAPSTPIVSDYGSCTNSTTTLRAQWSASDPDSGIAEYKYGIGTFPGDVDVINWTSAGTMTEVARTGLNLTSGITYYFTVKAKNGVGSWSSAGNSDGIIVDNTCVPVANAQSVSTFEDVAKAITLTATDPNDTILTWTIVATPTHGALSGTAPNVTYTPTANYNGADSITFKVNDGDVDSNTATVTIDITAVNDVPMANDQSVSTSEDTAKDVTLTATDPDDTTFTWTILTPPAHGSLSGTAPNVTYTPTANYNGADSFTFKVNDGDVDSNVAAVSINVTAVNDLPVANAQSVSTTEDAAQSITLTATDLDDTTFTWTIVAAPTHGALSGTAPNVTYTPTANYKGADSFTFKVNDGDVDSNTATVAITVTAVNDPPVAVEDSYNMNEDTVITITAPGVLGNDTDADSDSLTGIKVSGPGHGTLTLNDNGSFTYTPNANWYGTETFTYKANDGIADSNTATVTINVADAPETLYIYLPLIRR